MNLSLKAAFKQGNWNHELCDDILSAALKKPTSSNLILALDAAHAIRGVTEADITRIDEQVRGRRLTHWPLLYRLCSHDLARQRHDRVNSRLLRHKSAVVPLLKHRALKKFPRMLNYLAARDALPKALQQPAQQAARLIERSVSMPRCLEHLLESDSVPCVAVVGNGPSVQGSMAGQTIDQQGLVIRFNYSGVHGEFDADLGAKTDLWVLSPNAVTENALESSPLVALTGPDPWTRPSNYWRKLAGVRTTAFEVRRWHALVHKLQAPPSAGILVLDALLEAGVKPSAIAVFGFDRLSGGSLNKHGSAQISSKRTAKNTAKGSQNSSANHYRDNHPASARHNWAGEAELFQQMMLK